ncbi:MAG: alpha/beta hydrolase [Acidimicrobiales bacterium]|jgi:alpha-beta hydrolase superfamily lysophospholipase|nr:alpha/beta hydrolase [Acidimicrobiales bacterium]
MREIESVLTASDGARLQVYRWEPEGAPRAVVQLAHGLSEHAARYRRVAGVLADAGFVVIADDHRGHGRTATRFGRLGVARPGGWRAMVSDLHELTDLVRGEHPGLPVVLVGHSMGASLTLSYLPSWSGELAGVVLSGPPSLSLDEDVAGMVRQLGEADPDAPSPVFAQVFAHFNEPFAAVAEPGAPVTGFEWLSRDGDEVQRYVDDPLCGDGAPASNGFAADMLVDGAAMASPEQLARIRPDLPVLLLAGDRDPAAGGGDGVRTLAEGLQALGLERVETILYAEGRHEMLNETNRDQVHADLLAWLDRTIGS